MPVPSRRLLIVLAAFVLTAPSASATTFKIATVVPDGSSWLVEMRRAGKEIEEKTEGRVKLKFYPGGVMGNDKTVLRKMRAGQLQGGAFTAGALASIYPDIELYSLPLLFRDYDEVDAVREQLDQKLMDGLAEKGFVALSITDGGFAYVLSQKPIGQVEDMSGAKFWMVQDDKMSEIALELAGVSPVPLPIADVYTALQTGLIDTVAAPPMGAIAFQWHTKVHYLTDEPLMYLSGVMAIDRKAFQKISPADQKLVREIVSRAGERLDTASRVGEDNARDALRNQGVQFVTPSSEQEVQRWHDISAQAIEKLRAMGRYNDATIEQIESILEVYRTGPTAAR